MEEAKEIRRHGCLRVRSSKQKCIALFNVEADMWMTNTNRVSENAVEFRMLGMGISGNPPSQHRTEAWSNSASGPLVSLPDQEANLTSDVFYGSSLKLRQAG